MISLRLLSGFSVGTMPASASNGRVSSRMRPLDSAMVSMGKLSPSTCIRKAHSPLSAQAGPHRQKATTLARNAADLGTEHLQLLFDALITTVDVVDAVDQRVAFSGQGRNHQAGRSPQVGGHDRCAFQAVGTGNDGGVAFDLDLGAHAMQLVHVHETVF